MYPLYFTVYNHYLSQNYSVHSQSTVLHVFSKALLLSFTLFITHYHDSHYWGLPEALLPHIPHIHLNRASTDSDGAATGALLFFTTHIHVRRNRVP